MSLLILFSMIFIHCFIDFCTQRVLGDLKQKSWWEEHYPDEMYKHDYIGALVVHSFMWSFGIMIPIFWFSSLDEIYFMIGVFFLNFIGHCIIDDLKANKRKINLLQDQGLHFAQIFATWVVWSIIIVKGVYKLFL